MVPVDIQEDAVVPVQADIPVAAITVTVGIPVVAQVPVYILAVAIMETQEAGIQAEWEIMDMEIVDHLVRASSRAGDSAVVWARAAGNHPAVTAVLQEIMEI